jgi:hypothetical protein
MNFYEAPATPLFNRSVNKITSKEIQKMAQTRNVTPLKTQKEMTMESPRASIGHSHIRSILYTSQKTGRQLSPRRYQRGTTPCEIDKMPLIEIMRVSNTSQLYRSVCTEERQLFSNPANQIFTDELRAGRAIYQGGGSMVETDTELEEIRVDHEILRTRSTLKRLSLCSPGIERPTIV